MPERGAAKARRAGTQRAADWGVAAPSRARDAGAALAGGGAAAIIVSAALGLVAGWAASGVLLVLLAAAGYWWLRAQGRLALRACGAKPLPECEEPRLRNLVAGLAAQLSLAPPDIFIVPGGAANALCCVAPGPVVGVTAGLIERASRTELEAVLAHCLTRLATGEAADACLALALGPLGSRAAPVVGGADDVRAAALTRYPPGLGRALELATPRSCRFGPLWFVATSRCHVEVSQRVAALEDL